MLWKSWCRTGGRAGDRGGLPSPLGGLALLQQHADLALEVRDLLEVLVDGSEPEVGHLVRGPEPREDLQAVVAMGRYAKERMIEANLGLVYKMAHSYVGRGLEFEDLVQEGTLGLMLAVEKFDFARGLKFSTLATWWIRYGITVALGNKSRTVRVPREVHASINRLRKAEADLSMTLGRSPTSRELAEALSCREEKARFLMLVARSTLSLDEACGPGGIGLGDVLPDATSPNPAETLARRDTVNEVNEALLSLTEYELTYLRHQLGLGSKRPRSTAAISKNLGITQAEVDTIASRVDEVLNQVRSLLVECA